MARAVKLGGIMKFHALKKIAPKEAVGLVDDLMAKLSIASAEELISMTTAAKEKVMEIVGEKRKNQWAILYEKAQSVIPPDLLKELQTPVAPHPITSTIFCGPEPTKYGRFEIGNDIKIR